MSLLSKTSDIGIMMNGNKKNGHYNRLRMCPMLSKWENKERKSFSFRFRTLVKRLLHISLQIGVMHLQTTSRHGERLSTNGAFIRPIRKRRKNLTILTEAHVTRIIFDKSRTHSRKLLAKGVEFFHRKKLRRATAKKEVILSAGSINSPKILMLSGVGPKKHLESFNIEALLNLKVSIVKQIGTAVVLGEQRFYSARSDVETIYLHKLINVFLCVLETTI